MPRIHAGTHSRSRTGRSVAGDAAGARRRPPPPAPDDGEFGFGHDGPATGYAAPAPKAVGDRPAGRPGGKKAGGRKDRRAAGTRKKKPPRHALSDTSSDESGGDIDGWVGRQAGTSGGPRGGRRGASARGTARGGARGRRTPTHSSPKITLDCLEVKDGGGARPKRAARGAPSKGGGRTSPRSRGRGGSRGRSFEEYYRKGLGDADPLDSDSDGSDDPEAREDAEMASHRVYLPGGRDGAAAGDAGRAPPPRAVGVDNRSLPGVEGDGMARTYLAGLAGLVVRGAGSGVLASHGDGDGGTTLLAALSSSAGGTAACASSYLFEGISGEEERRRWLSDILSPVSPPAGFSAVETWSVLGNLLTSMADKLAESDHGASSRPHSATLFTTDAVLFADEEVGSHLEGLDGFWEQIRPAIETNAVGGVEVRIVETTAGLARSGDGELDGVDDEEGRATARAPDRYRAIAILNELRRRIAELNSARRLGTNDENGGGPSASRDEMDVAIEYTEGNHASLRVLHQDWVRAAFVASYGPDGTRGRVEFPLPESRHGSGVTVVLDVEYALLPSGLRSERTATLAEDMAELSSTRFEIVQTLPLTGVDSSLVHGVPMRARPGDCGDAARYSEMRLLVRQLWKCLGRNGVALVLRGVDGGGGDGGGGGEERLFLLAAEQAVEPVRAVDGRGEYDSHEARGIAPDEGSGGVVGQGVLYRYASAGQVLRFGAAEETRDEQPEVPPGVEEAVFESIESSLMGLDRTGLNPLLVRDGEGL